MSESFVDELLMLLLLLMMITTLLQCFQVALMPDIAFETENGWKLDA